MTPLESALAVATRGWPVFPCSPRTKQPLLKETKPGADDGGFHQATTDPEKIRGWWMKWPTALIGVPTGAPMSAFIIDLDVGDPPLISGKDYLERFIAHVGGVPHTAIAETASGGLHLYFAWDDSRPVGRAIRACPALDIKPDPNSTPKKGKRPKGAGIDVLGSDGYAIVPPSVREDGGAWRWLQELGDGIAPAPDRVFDIALKKERDATREEPAAPSASVMTADERIGQYVMAALERESRRLAQTPSGSRNDALNKAAYNLGQLVGAGALPENVVFAHLENACAKNGLAQDDGLKSVRATIRSGLRDGMAKPRNLSEVANSADPAAPKRARSARRAKPLDAPKDAGGPGGPGNRTPAETGDGGDGDEPDPDAVAKCVELPLNDTGNAKRLLVHFGANLLSVRDVGQHVWTGTHWEIEGGEEAFMRYAQRTADYIQWEAPLIVATRHEQQRIEEAVPYQIQVELTKQERAVLSDGNAAADAVAKRRVARRKFSISSGNNSRLTGMIAQALPHISIAPEQLDFNPLLVNVRNGTLRLTQRMVEDLECPDPNARREVLRWCVELLPHNRDDHITKIMPADYNPAAECPKWDAFLTRFQPHESVRRFLQTFHGYCLTGLMDLQMFPFYYGLGANGKTTFLETLARLQGSYAQVLPAETLTGDLQRRGDQATPEFARLTGARFVRCAEVPRGQGFRENILKMLTGGEKLLVRHLHCRFFELAPRFKAVGSGNDRPPVGGVDQGIWRRIKLVPWEVTIAQNEQRQMAAVLAEYAAESSGILNWLLAGLLDYLEYGVTVPDEIDTATGSYRADMDPVGEFAAVCIEPAEDETVTARDMYQAYTAWCHASSVKPFSEKAFAGIMTQKGYAKRRGRIRLYLNVRLSGVPDDPDLPV